MDFSKFIALLDTGTLYFARSDMLGDPFEGSNTAINITNRRLTYWPVTDLSNISAQLRQFTRWTYINCWHMSVVESAAMWRLYSKGEGGIAILSTFVALLRSLDPAPQTIHIGKVNYIDYSTGWFNEGNTLTPFLHKRISFQHERELRAIHVTPPITFPPLDTLPDTPIGIKIPVDLSMLIKRVYVAPTSPDWYYELVTSLTHRYLPEKEVVRSGLDDSPVF
jgi:hypothetical protein